ncbi:MAG: DNA-binding protein [Peptococcaceae bacterium]|nr:DNA-binding protein [Peptococcaceae bacterium]
MAFIPKKTANKETAVYKSLYIKEKLVIEIEKIAKEHDTSFNNVVVSMIEKCLESQ